MKIVIDVSDLNESTESPWWMIIDPKQLLKSNDREACHVVSSMVTGPFFSREAAQSELTSRRYAYGKNAVVFCASGYHSAEYKDAYRAAERADKTEMPS
jgi:hypothetical protein